MPQTSMESSREQSSRERAPMYSDDDLMTILQELHNPTKNTSDIRIRSMLSLVEDLINHATQTIGEHTEGANFLLENRIRKNVEGHTSGQTIRRISCQSTNEILNGNDAHTITIGLLKYLSNFYWEEKLMFTLTAFTITFGEFWLLVRIYANNAVNEPMTVDEREPTTVNKDAYKFQIQANNEFIKTLFNTTQCLIRDFKDLPDSYAQEMFGVGEGLHMHTSRKSDRFPIYAYWMMRCAIVAATQIIILSSRGLDQYLVGIPEPKECDKLNSLNKYVMLKLSDFRERRQKWYNIPKYLSLYSDIVEMMKRIITPDTDLHPLYHSVTKRKDDLDVLAGKRVLLLISGLNIASEDITNLKNVAIDSEKEEIVWIPVLKHTTSSVSNDVENQLEILQNSMPWYSIHQPSLITGSAIEAFIIEWNFKDRPILVFLSPEATELNKNAIYMLRIWRNLHVDNLTSEMELQLWEKETWNLKLLVNDIDPIIQEWVRDERYILMYGSNDIDWIRNFIRHARSIACNLLVHIEMVYMGNSHNKDHGCNVQDVIMTEQLSHCLPESSRACFYSRINSMIESKEKLGKMNDPTDKVLQEIQRFKSHEEWVLLAKGSAIIAHVPGRIALTALEQVQKMGAMLFKL